jgi:hypothetical protein
MVLHNQYTVLDFVKKIIFSTLKVCSLEHTEQCDQWR